MLYHSLAMATKKQPKPKVRQGRPPKSPSGSTVAQVNLKLIESDRAILEAIRAEEQARADQLGLPVHLSPADALRILLRSEGKRRGLDLAAAS